MHNACRADGARTWHFTAVDKSAMQQLEALRPAIKQRWEALLRLEPALTPLASPDTLVFLMDETLRQLNSALQARSFAAWLKMNAIHVAPTQSRCRCSINPLLTYYTTGELALRAAAGAALGAKIEEVLLYFHSLGQREIEALCGVCLHHDTEGCTDRAIDRNLQLRDRISRR